MEIVKATFKHIRSPAIIGRKDCEFSIVANPTPNHWASDQYWIRRARNSRYQ